MNQAIKQHEAKKTQAKVIEMDNRSVYVQNGFKDRQHYLNSLSYEYGIDMYSLSCIADMLGENEDFDGLISSLNDFGNVF
jgi:hypothetical protein